MENLKEKTIGELRKLCKEKGIRFENTDSKDMLIAKLNDYSKIEKKRLSDLEKVREKFNKKKKVIVTKLDPEDTVRDSVLVTITNAVGSFQFVVPFNVEVYLPEPVVKHLQNEKFQRWTRVNKGILGVVDVPTLSPKYNVQIIEE